MKKLKNLMSTLWKDESGQGMAEYVLLIVVVVGVAMIFKKQIMAMVQGKLDEVSGSMSSFKSDG